MLVGAAMAVAVSVAAAKITGNETVTPEMVLDRPKVVKGYDGPIYVLVDLAALEVERDDSERPALNLGLVLDRSGSMEAAGKIEYLKRAAGLAVDQLDGRDHLAIVEYDDKINVLWPAGPLENPTQVKSLINRLNPRGSTDLTGGMMRGVAEVMAGVKKQKHGEDAVSRVLLLSDGLANHGITDHGKIRELVRTAKAKGVRISTLGLGQDYDEDLMQLIAEGGGGHYYYIENPNQMGRIFEEELMTMFATVARDVSLGVDFGDRVAEVEAASFDGRVLSDKETVDLGDLYSGEKRTLIFRIEPDEEAFDRTGKVKLGDLDLVYRDAETGKKKLTSLPIEVEVVRSQAVADKAVNERVIVETMLLETEREHERAVRLYEKGELQQAQSVMKNLQDKTAGFASTYDDERLNQRVEALKVEQDQMEAVAAAPEAKADYLKKSKKRLFLSSSRSKAIYALEEGDKGLEVERLQEALTKTGDYKGPIDGLYSEELADAVKAYQAREGLDVDGIAGARTLSELGLY